MAGIVTLFLSFPLYTAALQQRSSNLGTRETFTPAPLLLSEKIEQVVAVFQRLYVHSTVRSQKCYPLLATNPRAPCCDSLFPWRERRIWALIASSGACHGRHPRGHVFQCGYHVYNSAGSRGMNCSLETTRGVHYLSSGPTHVSTHTSIADRGESYRGAFRARPPDPSRSSEILTVSREQLRFSRFF